MAAREALVRDAVGLAASLMERASREQGKVLVIDKSFWSRLLEAGVRGYGVHRFEGDGFEVVISRHGFPWGYLRAKVFDCYIEGILRFRQKVVYFKPVRLEGECRLYSAQADALGAPRGGVGAVEPEEVEW